MKEIKPTDAVNAIHTIQYPSFILNRYVKLNDIYDELEHNLRNHFGMGVLIYKLSTYNNNFIYVFDKGTIVFSRAEFDNQTYTLSNFVVLFY